MDRQPAVFDRLFRSMVRSGEQSGRLEDALERVAHQLEKLDALRRQIRSAMMYPAFVFGLAMVVLVVVVAFIVPIFAGVYEEIAADAPGESAELPFLTQINVALSGGADRLLVRDHSQPGRARGRLLQVEEDRRRAAHAGIGSS